MSGIVPSLSTLMDRTNSAGLSTNCVCMTALSPGFVKSCAWSGIGLEPSCALEPGIIGKSCC